jgi:hypothetical protein
MSRIVVVLSIAVFAAFMLFGSFIVQGQRPEPQTQPGQEMRPVVVPTTKQAQRPQRFREGTAFKDMLVFFRQNADRTVLYTADGEQRYTCLENLALERVLTAIQQKPERQFWKVDGEFSEFRGENFVSIRRFVVARTPTEGQ